MVLVPGSPSIAPVYPQYVARQRWKAFQLLVPS
jgi:hypothetical protein